MHLTTLTIHVYPVTEPPVESSSLKNRKSDQWVFLWYQIDGEVNSCLAKFTGGDGNDAANWIDDDGYEVSRYTELGDGLRLLGWADIPTPQFNA